MTHSYETWLIHVRHDSFMWDMTHSCETWLTCDEMHAVRRLLLQSIGTCETWLIHVRHDSFMWDMTPSPVTRCRQCGGRRCRTWEYMRRDLFVCDMTPSCETWLLYVRHDSFMWDMTPSCETWLLHMRHGSFVWDMTHSYETWLNHMRHDSFIWDMTPSPATKCRQCGGRHCRAWEQLLLLARRGARMRVWLFHLCLPAVLRGVAECMRHVYVHIYKYV